jgi:hypothetical protein
MPATPEKSPHSLLRLPASANPVLEMLMYFARTLRFLRSVFAQSDYARDGSSVIFDFRT